MAKKTPKPPKKSTTLASSKKNAKSGPATKLSTRQAAAPRRLKTPRYRSFRLEKRIHHPQPKLPNAFRLFGRALQLLLRHWKLFGGIVLIYGIFNTLFVAGLSAGSDLATLKDVIEN